MSLDFDQNDTEFCQDIVNKNLEKYGCSISPITIDIQSKPNKNNIKMIPIKLQVNLYSKLKNPNDTDFKISSIDCHENEYSIVSNPFCELLDDYNNYDSNFIKAVEMLRQKYGNRYMKISQDYDTNGFEDPWFTKGAISVYIYYYELYIPKTKDCDDADADELNDFWRSMDYNVFMDDKFVNKTFDTVIPYFKTHFVKCSEELYDYIYH